MTGPSTPTKPSRPTTPSLLPRLRQYTPTRPTTPPSPPLAALQTKIAQQQREIQFLLRFLRHTRDDARELVKQHADMALRCDPLVQENAALKERVAELERQIREGEVERGVLEVENLRLRLDAVDSKRGTLFLDGPSDGLDVSVDTVHLGIHSSLDETTLGLVTEPSSPESADLDKHTVRDSVDAIDSTLETKHTPEEPPAAPLAVTSMTLCTGCSYQLPTTTAALTTTQTQRPAHSLLDLIDDPLGITQLVLARPLLLDGCGCGSCEAVRAGKRRVVDVVALALTPRRLRREVSRVAMRGGW